ncbi:MAG: SDR family NAD(P)-dependent oxidoreductase [Alphaproteobacteria bacterium]|nr:SDR family NAD(P)-dependent oxidoreductase [Alphaproteobacteria bacterium]
MTAAAPRLFCFGLGYSALALAEALAARGWRIAGTCRSVEKQRALAARGVEAQIFDRDRPLAAAPTALAGTTHLLSSVPPDASGDPVIDLHGDDIGALKELAWAGYLSTTGVYGDHAGGWVDEDTPRTPVGERGRRRVAAEDAWLGLWRRFGTPVHLFRLAGIYGPGRNALETVKAGDARRVVKPGQVFSRIHRDDIVQALIASMDAPDPGAAYNLCDDEAAPPQDVIAYACALLGREPPPEIPFSAAELSPMARSFYDDNKRVRNRRMKQALGVSLTWPTYREGLKGLL